MDDDFELIELSDKTGDSRSAEIWQWFMGRIHDQAIVVKMQELIDQCHTEMEAQGKADWVGGFVVSKHYRCHLENGTMVPVLYKFTYLRHRPLTRKFTSDQFEESFGDSAEYSCYLRPDETESEFIEYIRSVKLN